MLYRCCLFSIFFLVLSSCSIYKERINIEREEDYISFTQNGKTFDIRDDYSKIELKRDKFSIQFFNKVSNPDNKSYFFTKIAVLPSKSHLDKIQLGNNSKAISNFEAGSSLAITKGKGYENRIYINDYGHHVFFYVDKDRKSGNIIAKQDNNVQFEFLIKEIFQDPGFLPISNTDIEALYLAFFSDKNLNNIFDKGELFKIAIEFN